MNLQLKILNLIYQILSKNLDCKVFTNVPNNAITPYVRIGEFETKDWLFSPKSFILNLTLSIFSELSSVTETVMISDKIKLLLAKMLIKEDNKFIIHSSITKDNIFQLQNLTWVAELQYQIYTVN